MDHKTLAAHERDAAAFASEWHAQPAPSDLQAAVRCFFKPGPTADIGCGSGRDAGWLARNGFPVTGYDASEGLLAQARRLHPDVRFAQAALPELQGIAAETFVNVLCETVIMHLATDAIARSIGRLMAILQPGGTLYLSWRVTEGADTRDAHGRLYTAFDPSLVLQALVKANVLLDEQGISISSGKMVRRLVARKTKAD